MKCSELESKYLRNFTVENRNQKKNENNFCRKLYKKERKKLYWNLDIKNITDNKLFWKIMTPFLINVLWFLEYQDNIFYEDQELSKTSVSNPFENAFDNLVIK